MNVFFTDFSKSWHGPKNEKVLFDINTVDIPQVGTEIVFQGYKYRVFNICRNYGVVSTEHDTPLCSISSVEVELVRI